MIDRAIRKLLSGLLKLQLKGLPEICWLPRYDLVKSLIRTDARWTLEAASGTGDLSIWMRQQHMQVVGVNLLKHETRIAGRQAKQKRTDLTFFLGDLTGKTPFRSGCFDQIVSLDTVTHIPDDAATFAEFHRLLQPGGRLVISLAAFAPSGSGVLYPVQDMLRRWVPRFLHGDPICNGRPWLSADPEDMKVCFQTQYHFYRLGPLLERLRASFQLEHWEYGIRFFTALATDLMLGIRYVRYLEPLMFIAGNLLDKLLCSPKRHGYLLFVVLKKI